MSEQRRWVKQWLSDYLDLVNFLRGERQYAGWFNDQYETCKTYLRLEAARDGVNPDALSYDVKVEQDRWDLRLTVTATEVTQ